MLVRLMGQVLRDDACDDAWNPVLSQEGATFSLFDVVSYQSKPSRKKAGVRQNVGFKCNKGALWLELQLIVIKTVCARFFFGLCKHLCLMMIHRNRTICRAFVLS